MAQEPRLEGGGVGAAVEEAFAQAAEDEGAGRRVAGGKTGGRGEEAVRVGTVEEREGVEKPPPPA